MVFFWSHCHTHGLFLVTLSHHGLFMVTLSHHGLFLATLSHQGLFLVTLSHNGLFLVTLSHQGLFCHPHRLFPPPPPPPAPLDAEPCFVWLRWWWDTMLRVSHCHTSVFSTILPTTPPPKHRAILWLWWWDTCYMSHTMVSPATSPPPLPPPPSPPPHPQNTEPYFGYGGGTHVTCLTLWSLLLLLPPPLPPSLHPPSPHPRPHPHPGRYRALLWPWC